MRPATLNDAQWFLSIRSNPVFMEHMNRPLMESVEQARDHLQNIIDRVASGTGIQSIIELKDTGEPIGYCGFWRWEMNNRLGELGYGLHPDHTGKGYMLEAIRSYLHFGFEEMKLHRAEAYVMALNTASSSVLEKSGFILECRLKDATLRDKTFEDLLVYRILEDEYLSE